MVFSSTVFLFIFLPAVLIINFLLRHDYRNIFLLVVSLFFYAWGEGILVLLMIVSTCVNYLAGLGISYFKNRVLVKATLGLAITINLLFLIYYKYLNFIFDTFPFLSSLFAVNTSSIILPIGISFYTFHAISYLVDIYRKGLPGQKNFFDLGLYIAFFPQLVAGPIVRYSDIVDQLKHRTTDFNLFFEGAIRFIRGLGKKIIIANTLGLFADRVFDTPIKEIPTSISWIGIVCYTLQIYYDFSGYSDMAIGLAKMFGFHFKENFNHPYIAKSIQDFWRRWHISLSTWFRDYLYISLGGNQKGIYRTYVNLVIVFFVTGLWHGASWNFIIWGLFHGLFLVLERSNIIKLDKFPVPLKHFYVTMVVMIGWVFFRAETLRDASRYLRVMAGIISGDNYSALISANYYTVVVFLLGILFCMPIRITWSTYIEKLTRAQNFFLIGKCVFYFSLLLWCISELATSSYNPFIYFRF